MEIEKIKQLLNEMKNKNITEAYLVYDNGKKEKRRFFYKSEYVFIFEKNKKSYGLDFFNFIIKI